MTERYVNEAYDFSLRLPADLEARIYHGKAAAIGHLRGEALEPIAELNVATDLPGEHDGMRYADFVIERVRAPCAADGPGESHSCTGVQLMQPFETPEGVAGLVFYLRHERAELPVGNVLEVSVRGPFFALDLGGRMPGHRLAALLERPPAPVARSEVDARLVREITMSVEFGR